MVLIGYNQVTRLCIQHLNYWSELVDDEVGQNGRADSVTGL